MWLFGARIFEAMVFEAMAFEARFTRGHWGCFVPIVELSVCLLEGYSHRKWLITERIMLSALGLSYIQAEEMTEGLAPV